MHPNVQDHLRNAKTPNDAEGHILMEMTPIRMDDRLNEISPDIRVFLHFNTTNINFNIIFCGSICLFECRKLPTDILSVDEITILILNLMTLQCLCWMSPLPRAFWSRQYRL